jgi:hypothetical protein
VPAGSVVDVVAPGIVVGAAVVVVLVVVVTGATVAAGPTPGKHVKP